MTPGGGGGVRAARHRSDRRPGALLRGRLDRRPADRFPHARPGPRDAARRRRDGPRRHRRHGAAAGHRRHGREGGDQRRHGGLPPRLLPDRPRRAVGHAGSGIQRPHRHHEHRRSRHLHHRERPHGGRGGHERPAQRTRARKPRERDDRTGAAAGRVERDGGQDRRAWTAPPSDTPASTRCASRRIPRPPHGSRSRSRSASPRTTRSSPSSPPRGRVRSPTTSWRIPSACS